MRYAHVLAEAASTLWALELPTLQGLVQVMQRAIDGEKLSAVEIDARISAARLHPNTDRAVANRQGAVGLIPVRGVISNRASMIDNVSSGVGTNMEALGRAFRGAMADDSIKAIVFDVDSQGGSVSGITEMAREIRDARGSKPMIAQVNATCASAAYWLMSSVDEIVMTPSGKAGSIGVYTIHEDLSKAMAKAGIKTTIVAAGKYKAEGNPFEKLDAEAATAMQADVDAFYGLFVNDVAAGRGVSASTVSSKFGQGRALTAQVALANGLVDRLGTLQDTLARWGVKGASASKGSAPSRSSRAESAAMALRRRRLELAEMDL